MTYHLTHHAIARYRERVEPCSQHEASDRLLHAAEISRPAYVRHLRYLLGHGWMGVGMDGNPHVRYCPVEGLLLVCREASQGGLLVVTVIREQEKWN